MTATAVILAAGRGDRMQMGINKIVVPVGGVPIICHTVRAFAEAAGIDEIIVVAHANEVETMKRLIEPVSVRHVCFVRGGATRRDSALAGVQAAKGDIVLIHDGARPFPSQVLIHNVLALVKQEKAVIPVLSVTDLLHRLMPSGVITAQPDSVPLLARAQTPQGFDRELILRCLEKAPPDIRDDASAVLLVGQQVSTISGERTNIKITGPDDLPLAEAIAIRLGL